MNRISRIISGIALLAFAAVWVMELTGVISINLEGWWTLFVIIPCFIAIFNSKNKSMPLLGLGIGILLLLAARDIILWNDFWKYIICIIAVIWGFSLIFSRKSHLASQKPDRNTVNELKQIDQDGRQIRQLNVCFGKQLFEFAGQHFEGADVRASFGFIALDLRNADLLDGAVINIDCSFGGMEIRVDRNVCVKTAVETAFAGVESQCELHPSDGVKTLYIKGECNFGGIEIK